MHTKFTLNTKVFIQEQISLSVKGRKTVAKKILIVENSEVKFVTDRFKVCQDELLWFFIRRKTKALGENTTDTEWFPPFWLVHNAANGILIEEGALLLCGREIHTCC